jgi:ATP-dependent helicase/nuclease subunit B
MPVQFIIGRAGSGKTRHCFNAIVEAIRQEPLGPRIYWLLPRQATFSAERELTCLSGLDAFCRARVVSFEAFGRDVFEACGGSSIPEVTPLGRQMILGHLLRQNRSKLKFFSSVARQPGLAAELDATFAELERSGKTVAELSTTLDELSDSNGADVELAPLMEKLHDTRLLYEAYTNYLGQERLDQHRRSTQVQALLSQCEFLKTAKIYVDGFVDFTQYERLIVVGAAKAGSQIHISLRMDPGSPTLANPHTLPDEMSLFRRTEETYRKLFFAFTEAGIAVDEPMRLEKTHRFAAPALEAIEQSLFGDPIVPEDNSEGLELIEAPDDRAEVDAVARQIGALLKSGMRLRDIGVLVRSLDRYHTLIDASFREHGIAYFVDRRRQATHHPLLQFLRSAFQISRHDWPHDAAMSLLRTGLGQISLFDADGLENYVLSHRIRGIEGWEAPAPWKFRRNLMGAEDSAADDPASPENADELRRHLTDKLVPLLRLLRQDRPLSVRQLASEIFSTLERFSVRQTIATWAQQSADAGQFEQSAEHEQVWANLVNLFDQMVDLLGDEQITPAEFNDVMEAGLDSFDLALTPPTLDQVLVGQADRTRTPALKAVFVLGLNEGDFPHVPSDGSILTDRDRRNLRRRRIELDPGLQQRLFDERFLGYVAFTRASQRLYISRPLSDGEGRATEPSSFWRRIISLFPDVRITPVRPSHAMEPDTIATPRQLVSGLMRWVRSDPDPLQGSANSTWAAIYQWFASRAREGEAPAEPQAPPGVAARLGGSLALPSGSIQTLYNRAWNALTYANTSVLSAEVIPHLFASPLQASVSQLETYASCPFKHFARFVLGLRERERQEVTAQDLGQLYHKLLESALQEVLQRRSQGDKTITLESAAEKFVEKLAGAIRGELMLGSARNRYLLDRVRKTIQQIARSQREILKRGLFRPQHVGVSFGPNGKLPSLRIATPSGAEALLQGKIDRVDRVEGSDDAAVIDYRLGQAKLPIGMVMHGLSLQLLSYLLVLKANGTKLAGKPFDPAAAFYLQLIRKIEDVKHPNDAAEITDPKWHLKLRPRGVFDRRCLGALDRNLTTGASEVVSAFINKDGALGKRKYSDVTESHEFRDLLTTVSAKLGELADGILSGNVDIAPYRLKDKSPCPHCEYRSVCRFDPSINRYRHLESIGADQVFAKGEQNA